jgi:hypothetical protein
MPRPRDPLPTSFGLTGYAGPQPFRLVVLCRAASWDSRLMEAGRDLCPQLALGPADGRTMNLITNLRRDRAP